MKGIAIGALILFAIIIMGLAIIAIMLAIDYLPCHSQCKYGDSPCKKHCIERHYCPAEPEDQ